MTTWDTLLQILQSAKNICTVLQTKDSVLECRYKKQRREKMENVAEYRVGDRVVFDWVFDEPQEVAVVCVVDGDYVEVESAGLLFRLHVDAIDFESNWC